MKLDRTAFWAGKFRREEYFLFIVDIDDDRLAVRVAQRGFEGFGEPLLHFRLHAQPVDHRFHCML